MTLPQKLFLVSVKLLSSLPWRMLYFLSDFVAFVVYYIIGYRKKVVYENLTNSFPYKSKKEIRKIARQFYRHLADILVETICEEKIIPNVSAHMRFKDKELLDRLYKTGKSVIFVGGHSGNWEWVGISMEALAPYKARGVIKPLSDPFFNNYIENIRSKYSSGVISFKQILRFMLKSKGQQFLYMFATDQTPHRDEINYWVHFLNQPTPVFLGTEKIAKALDMPVIYLDCYRVKRGCYELAMTLITDAPKLTEEFEITDKQFALLEQSIINRPYNWLWSHRRWKYKDEYPKYLEQLAQSTQ
ncbi:MAG: lysophospholipid acyltransferase family protein [Bacteroidota bacterium]|nr:lysophospholipid acyltransferase family protein [Bacteroidota bacterium]MDP4289714.1 lysophospholipid acyltransferase family protein [Bacteroidota bacterium]